MSLFMKFNFLTILLVFLYEFNCVVTHAFLARPPARSSAWQYDKDFEKCCTHYNHNQMYCGGVDMLWFKFGGKCGICGEAWNETREFEKGGTKYLGKILAKYTKGDSMNVTIVLTANHNGYVEFRLCNVDNTQQEANQECLNKTLLNIKNTNSTKLYVHTYPSYATISYSLDLPQDLTCAHCVLQMKYVTANRWGTDESTNESCVGCGVIQEQFYGCADISIRDTSRETQIEDNLIIESLSNEIKDLSNETSTVENNTNESKNSTSNCKSKLEYGKTLDLSTIVNIYCNRICNGLCKSSSLNAFNDTQVCDQTCIVLCECD